MELGKIIEYLKELRNVELNQLFKSVEKEEADIKLDNISFGKSKKLDNALTYFDKRKALKNNIDYIRMKELQYNAFDHDDWNDTLKYKNRDFKPLFSDYTQFALNNYSKNTDNFNEKVTESFLSKRDGIDKMVSDLNRQLIEKTKFSKRKKFNNDQEVTYINQRNYKFNQKISRAYDSYTKNLRENLERGSAE